MIKKMIKIIYLLVTCILTSTFTYGQPGWTWTPLDTLPIPISNNAVTQATIGGSSYVYSFGGIGTSKTYSDITLRSFKYDVLNNTWSEIAPLPSGQPRIAAAASTVKNKIYIIGGYSVAANGNETSANNVNIYNPLTDTYEADGAVIPTAIDDQVQCVWKDSLIYVITGWSNFSNVPKVQIYNPAIDTWLTGTTTPNTADFKVFGGSGYIIGDTIFYFGGAVSISNFYATKTLRKGIIDPQDPTNITWTVEDDGPNNGYRQACFTYNNHLFWLGGSAISYNYDGIAYNGSGGVPPLTQIMMYRPATQTWFDGFGAPYGIMDLRGNGKIANNAWIIAGGMMDNQEVTNKSFKVELDTNYLKIESNNSKLYTYVFDHHIYSEEKIKKATLYDVTGKIIEHIDLNTLNISQTKHGIYFLKIYLNEQTIFLKIIL